MEPLPGRIETPRLVLRVWEVLDVGALADAVTANLDHLRPYMSWIDQEPMADDARAALILSWQDQLAEGGEAVYGMFAAGEVVGGCGLIPRIGPGGLEIGYWVHRAHTRKGYAAEAARALTTAALAHPGIGRVEIRHDRSNVASSGVPAKLGYRRDGTRDRPPVAPAETGVQWVWYTDHSLWADPGP